MWTFSILLMTLLMFSGLFLIGLILLQRGRGGGLAGAFGGMGGQSAFGTKAGDVFTRITIGVASVWILLCAGGVVTLRYAASGIRTDEGLFKKANAAEVKKANPAEETPEGDAALPLPGGRNENANAEKPGNQKPEENTPAAKPEDKTEEPAPAKPQNKPEPDKDKPAEEKKAEEKATEEKPAEPPK